MWFEVAVASTLFALGNIVFGHFEEGTPKWRRILRLALFIAISVAISTILGRAWFWGFLGTMTLPVLYIHAVWLPSKGINGWTGEPKDRYYKLRGWKR
jgi:hypothetical protein